MSEFQVYQAGPIQHVSDGGHGWRDHLVETYSEIDWLNPLDKYDGNAEAVVVHNGTPPDDVERDVELVSVTELVETDKAMIRSSDAVLVGWDDVPSCGTPMEVHLAFTLDTPVVCRYDGDGVSPWMTYHADAIYSTFDECVDQFLTLIDDVDAIECVRCGETFDSYTERTMHTIRQRCPEIDSQNDVDSVDTAHGFEELLGSKPNTDERGDDG